MSKRKPIQKKPLTVSVRRTSEGRKWAFQHTLSMLRKIWKEISVFRIRKL